MTKRWGKKYKDKRNWVKYNEELVVRGEFLLDLDWVKSWDKEVDEMNDGKRGNPYQFPDSLIKLQAVWHQWVDYRGIEGITRKLVEFDKLKKCNDYSTINRRVNKIETDFELPRQGSVSVSCDGSGMKMTNRGEYRQSKYGNRKKYLKVVISADPIKKKLLKCDVSIDGEGSSESETAETHLQKLIDEGIEVDKFWGDGSFDGKELFNFLEKHDIPSAIKIRKNASLNAGGSLRRAREVKEYKKEGYKRWAKNKNYGRRWTGTEGIFSAVKRKFGENVRSRKIRNIFKETRRKFWAYETMKNYALK
jgi:hypothetical protein